MILKTFRAFGVAIFLHGDLISLQFLSVEALHWWAVRDIYHAQAPSIDD